MASFIVNALHTIGKGASYVMSAMTGDTKEKVKLHREVTESSLAVLNEAIDKAAIKGLFNNLNNSLDPLDKTHPHIKEAILNEVQSFNNKTIQVTPGSNDPNIALKQVLNNISTKLTDYNKNLNNPEDKKALNNALNLVNKFKEDNLHLTEGRGVNFSRAQSFAKKIGIDLVKFEEKYPRVAKAVDVTTDAINKLPSVLLNQTTSRVLFLAAVGAAAVATGGTLAIASAAAAGVATAVGIGLQVRKLQQVRDIHEERNLLKEYHNELQQSENISRDPAIAPLLTKQSFLENGKVKNSHQFDSKQSKKEASFLTSAASFIRDNIGETGVSLALSALSLNPAIIAVTTGTAILSSTASIIERKNMDEQLNTIKKDIDHLRLQTPGYDNVFELKNKLKSTQLENEAFKQLSSKTEFSSMSADEKKQGFLDIKEQLANSPQFKIEPSPGLFSKAGNAIKNFASDVANVVLVSPFKNPLESVVEKGMEKHEELEKQSAALRTNQQHKSQVFESVKEAGVMASKSLAAGSVLLLAGSVIPGAITGATTAGFAASAGTIAALAVATSAPSTIDSISKSQNTTPNPHLQEHQHVQSTEHQKQQHNLNHAQQEYQTKDVSVAPPETPSVPHPHDHGRSL